MVLPTTKIKQQLKARAHKLKPVVIIGSQGLTVAVMKEIDRALTDHELIKVRLSGDHRAERMEMAKQICTTLSAELLQLIGHIGIFFRRNK